MFVLVNLKPLTRLAGRRGGLISMMQVVYFIQRHFGPDDFQVSKIGPEAYPLLRNAFYQAMVMYIYLVVVSLSIHAQVTRDLDEIIKNKSDFVTRMSHELRTPLTGIIGAVDLIRREQSMPAEAQALFHIVDTCSKSMVRLVTDILDMNKIMTPTGPLTLQESTVDVRDLLTDVVSVVDPVARAKGVTINLDTHGLDQRFYIATDKLRLHQVLTNVLANAVKFTLEGHVNVAAKFVNCGPKTATLEINVEDTGIGMDGYTLERLFTPFEQGSLKGSFGGSGLGLSISRYIVSLLGGTVSASSPGRGLGSTFCICLPVTFPSPSSSGVSSVKKEKRKPRFKEPAPTSANLPMASRAGDGAERIANFAESPSNSTEDLHRLGHVLLAEDRPCFSSVFPCFSRCFLPFSDQFNQIVFKRILASLQYSYDVADNGQKALDLLDSGKKYDAILLDWEMPVLDGYETAVAIQYDRRIETPIVFLSAHSPDALREMLAKSSKRLKVHDILAKPLNITSLALVLQKAHPTSSSSRTSESE